MYARYSMITKTIVGRISVCSSLTKRSGTYLYTAAAKSVSPRTCSFAGKSRIRTGFPKTKAPTKTKPIDAMSMIVATTRTGANI